MRGIAAAPSFEVANGRSGRAQPSVLRSGEAVRNLAPDLQLVARLPAGGLIITAQRRAGGVVSRYFAPAYGIPEDPVTGSAH